MSSDKFEEIKEQIKELLQEALDIVPEHATSRAESYWYPQIIKALDDDHDYLGKCMCSMQNTIEEWHDSDEND